MKICLVTTFPPSTGGLSEYGFHIAQELQRNPFLDLTVLADGLPADHVEPDGFNVIRCWSFDDPMTIFHLLKTIQRLKPDVVWFNLLFSTFGRNPIIAFGGLLTPLLARLGGRYTHVTLHHLMDTVELKDVGVRHEALYRAAGALATRMLLLSNSVSVLMPGYRKILNDKYGRDNVHLRAHGLLARRPEFPDFARRGNPVHRILAFGKWGTYKRLELMVEAFRLLASRMPNVRLVVGGGDHPQASGYIASMKRQYVGDPRIEFRGYVPESELPELFQTASVAVMPYSSSTGCSGVAHLAAAFSVPVICADIPDFRQMAQSEELAIEFYPSGNTQGLADCLFEFLNNSEKQQTMAIQNFSAALRMTMPNVVQKYLRHFEIHQRAQTLRHISRFRRLPRWMPSKSLLLRFMTRNRLSWARRSVVLHAPWSEIPPGSLLNGYGNGRGELHGSRIPMNGHDVSVLGSRVGGASGVATTGDGSHQNRSHGTSSENTENTVPIQTPNQQYPEQSDAENSIGKKEEAQLLAVPIGRQRSGTDRQDGGRAIATRSNRPGSEQTF